MNNITKKCRKCSLEKPLDDFYKHKTSKDGRHSYCKICAKKGASYAYRSLGQKEEMAKRSKERRRAFMKFVDDIKTYNKCYNCKEDDPCCLDFHHLNSDEKERSISKLAQAKSPKIIDEIKKCVVTCSNCHRKIHAGKLKVYKKHLCKIKGSLVSTVNMGNF